MDKSWFYKEWFIIMDEEQEGPYSLHDLKRDWRFTPDTLVWKEGFSSWLPARDVSELDEVFKDEPEALPLHEPPKSKRLPSHIKLEQETLTLQTDPPQFLFWVIVIIFILLYMIFQIYSH